MKRGETFLEARTRSYNFITGCRVKDCFEMIVEMLLTVAIYRDPAYLIFGIHATLLE